MKLAGTPTGTATPTASRSRPMSSMPTHQRWPAYDTGSARLAACRPASQPPTSAAVERCGDLGLGERPQQPQQVGHRLGVAGRAVVGQVLQLTRRGGDDLGVEQLAQFDAAEQFGQQGAVQRECRRTALGQRAVALVHERADIAEQQRGRER